MGTRALTVFMSPRSDPPTELVPGAVLLRPLDGYPGAHLADLKRFSCGKTYESSGHLTAQIASRLIHRFRPEMRSWIVFVQLQEEIEANALYELWLNNGRIMCSVYLLDPGKWNYAAHPNSAKLLYIGALEDADVATIQQIYDLYEYGWAS